MKVSVISAIAAGIGVIGHGKRVLKGSECNDVKSLKKIPTTEQTSSLKYGLITSEGKG